MSANLLTALGLTRFHVRRAVKMNLANEGLEAKKKEEEVMAKKRKAEEDANWEGWWPKWLLLADVVY